MLLQWSYCELKNSSKSSEFVRRVLYHLHQSYRFSLAALKIKEICVVEKQILPSGDRSEGKISIASGQFSHMYWKTLSWEYFFFKMTIM